ncbi:MAG: hypothetical protein ACQGVC_18545 [Myxococcota bacterium]
MSSRPPLPRQTPGMRPRFTLGMLYLFAFFFLFCLLLVAPALWEVLHSMPPGPEMEAAANRAAREAMQGKMLLAFALATAATGAGMYTGWLPGTRA